MMKSTQRSILLLLCATLSQGCTAGAGPEEDDMVEDDFSYDRQTRGVMEGLRSHLQRDFPSVRADGYTMWLDTQFMNVHKGHAVIIADLVKLDRNGAMLPMTEDDFARSVYRGRPPGSVGGRVFAGLFRQPDGNFMLATGGTRVALGFGDHAGKMDDWSDVFGLFPSVIPQ